MKYPASASTPQGCGLGDEYGLKNIPEEEMR